MTDCHLIVEELESCSADPGMLPISFATSVLQGLRRTLEEVSAEAGPTVGQECLVQIFAREPGQISNDEFNGLPLDPKLVAEAMKEEYTNKGDAANPFIRARLVAQETEIVSELTPSSTFAAALPQGHAQSDV